MEELLIQWAQENSWLAYALLFASAVVENLLPPIPGDTVTLAGAYFVGTGLLSFSGVLISTTLGSVVGFMGLYLVAYRLGWEYFEKKNYKWIQPDQLRRVDLWFDHYGYAIILANRFLSGIRSVISISAGLSKLHTWRVAVLATISALIWNGMIIYFGAVIGKSKDEILGYIQLYNKIFIGILISGIILYVIYRFFRKRPAA